MPMTLGGSAPIWTGLGLLSSGAAWLTIVDISLTSSSDLIESVHVCRMAKMVAMVSGES